jgi:hypothetical protein
LFARQRSATVSKSALEAAFLQAWRIYASDYPQPETEYRFAAHAVGGPGRGVRARLEADGLADWRFDFAWVSEGVALELDGGTWANGRHSRGAGYAEDCRKLNAAVTMGWRVYRLTSDMLKADPMGAVEMVKASLN